MFENLENCRFTRLTAIKRIDGKWLCRCDCGTEKRVFPGNLKRGLTKSCGCFRRETSAEKMKDVRCRRKAGHQMSHTPEHDTWIEIRKRCADMERADYGGRGIKVCDRWQSFENFFADMGERPTDQHSIERIENDGDYEPGNCRWATKVEQALNTRRNLIVTAFGKTAPLGAFISHQDEPVRYKKVWKRIQRGWDAERALTAANDTRGGAQCR